MTDIMSDEPQQQSQWRMQANKAAQHIKTHDVDRKTPDAKLVFLFDDLTVTVEIPWAVIDVMTEQELADSLFDVVRKGIAKSSPGAEDSAAKGH